jgi:histidine triad (HIT) family protein
MLMAGYCVFCDLLSGQLEVSLVYRDELCAAFMDVQPINPGHMLVVPLRHCSHVAELHPDEGAQVFRVAQKLTEALRKSSVRCEGVNLFLADGEAAGQEVFHTHLHVIPRYVGDGFGIKLPPAYENRPERSELDSLAKTIRRLLLQSPITNG